MSQTCSKIFLGLVLKFKKIGFVISENGILQNINSSYNFISTSKQTYLGKFVIISKLNKES